MNIKMSDLLGIIAAAFDVVESELLGATTNHSKRLAVLVAGMGRHLGFAEDRLMTVIIGALFHDNALTEYILSERPGLGQEFHMKQHCLIGQRNIESLVFTTDITGMVLYHHEQADGGGPFGKKEGEYPLEAELIAMADGLDVVYKLQNCSVEKLPALQRYIKAKAGSFYTQGAAEAMLHVFDAEMLRSLGDNEIVETVHNLIPDWIVDVECSAVARMAEFLACTIDYKSQFTRKHSTDIARKLLTMSDFYKFDPTTRAKAYIAASFHDIGKIKTPTAILEKNGKLTDSEFAIIKKHIYYTYEMLKDIEGFEDICAWASNHHEKLDGTGYPFGKKADELDFISRLMACLDIYQAVSEERPYHPARSHEATMTILYNMAKNGFVDEQIVKDVDKAMGEYSAWVESTVGQ